MLSFLPFFLAFAQRPFVFLSQPFARSELVASCASGRTKRFENAVEYVVDVLLLSHVRGSAEEARKGWAASVYCTPCLPLTPRDPRTTCGMLELPDVDNWYALLPRTLCLNGVCGRSNEHAVLHPGGF